MPFALPLNCAFRSSPSMDAFFIFVTRFVRAYETNPHHKNESIIFGQIPGDLLNIIAMLYIQMNMGHLVSFALVSS